MKLAFRTIDGWTPWENHRLAKGDNKCPRCASTLFSGPTGAYCDAVHI